MLRTSARGLCVVMGRASLSHTSLSSDLYISICIPSFFSAQVQDAGLIFLSAMASSVVEQCRAAGASKEATISTVRSLPASAVLTSICRTYGGKLAARVPRDSVLVSIALTVFSAVAAARLAVPFHPPPPPSPPARAGLFYLFALVRRCW